MSSDNKLPQPIHYQFWVKGRLDATWADWFDGMQLVAAGQEEGTPISYIQGQVIDQAALHGMLRKIRDLGLTLLEVKRVMSDQN